MSRASAVCVSTINMIGTRASAVAARMANMLQKARDSSKTVAAVVSLAGTAAGMYKYFEQLSKLAKFVVNEAQSSCTRGATAVTEITMNAMQYMEQRTDLTALQVRFCSLLHYM
jgi:hypothetical protein